MSVDQSYLSISNHKVPITALLFAKWFKASVTWDPPFPQGTQGKIYPSTVDIPEAIAFYIVVAPFESICPFFIFLIEKNITNLS